MPGFKYFGTEYSVEVKYARSIVLWPPCPQTASKLHVDRHRFFANRLQPFVLVGAVLLSCLNHRQSFAALTKHSTSFFSPQQCFCAMSLPSDFQTGHDSCNFACAGNSGETCGEYCTEWVLFPRVERVASCDTLPARAAFESLLLLLILVVECRRKGSAVVLEAAWLASLENSTCEKKKCS